MSQVKLSELLLVILLTDSTFEIHARLVIKPTGPWSDEVRNLGGEGLGVLQMRPRTKVYT